MPILDSGVRRRVSLGITLCLCGALLALPASSGQAQTSFENDAVGGVSIDAQGLLENAAVDDAGKLRQLRTEQLQPIPGGLNALAPLRKVSLRRLEAAMQQYLEDGKALPEEMQHLAGLQEIHYVFVYPEEHDIVLAGPGEGWKVDAKGTLVGITTGKPVMLLDDLLVALRTARSSAQTGISCSIDPTAEGLTRLRGFVGKLRTIGNPRTTIAGIEQALGQQAISVTGVPATTHFARVLVAADYRMKRLAMGFEPAPVNGLPSFLEMMKATGRGMSNMLPRWWLAPAYEPLLRDEDGLAWQLRGAAVKAMTEQDFVTASGAREHTGRKSPLAQRWADNMTQKYPQLAVADPIFGQLRNCMDLAVVAALVVREDLTAKAGFSMPVLMDAGRVEVDKFDAPTHVASQASVLRKGKKWLISASGGVQIPAFAIVEKTEPTTTLAPLRQKAAANRSNWWWN